MEKILQNFEDKIDNTKLFEFLKPFKNEMDLLCRKYYKNGTIDANQIHSDLKSLSVMNEERSWGELDFDEDDNNNIILRYLYKFFIKWPTDFIKGLWDFFKVTVIEPWEDGIGGKFISVMSMSLWILVGILIYVVSVWSFLFFDMKMNGLHSGKVTETQFEVAHQEQRSNVIMVGKTTIVQYYTVDIPDRWHIQVEGENGRVEDWVTYDKSASDKAQPGEEVTKNQDWSWEMTEKR